MRNDPTTFFQCSRCGESVFAFPSDIKKGRKFCSKKCRYPSLEKRFWDLVKKQDGQQCWIWMARTDKDGYGVIRDMQKTWKAHRFAYVITFGPIPDGKMVLHSCDNPPCCNPSHLRIGTAKDNANDVLIRHRDTGRIGEANFNAKLNPEKVVEIRRLHHENNLSYPAIAKMFDVGTTSIGYIIQGKTWKHVV